MALSNRERVGRVLETLNVGLRPFVVREYRTVYGGGDFEQMQDALGTASFPGLPEAARADDRVLLAALDTQACLNLMWRRWNEVFHAKLGYVARSYVSEMMEARNLWAHQAAFSNDEAYRVADTAARLLRAVSAAQEAATVEEHARELLRVRFEAEAERARKEVTVQQGMVTTALAGLRSWREVVQPHPDVASGRYIQAEFAADLSQVIAGTAEAEYQDPSEFFRRTYLTEGLLALLVTGVRRLTAQGGDPVVQLQTAFGGGKTHSMLALYHLCSGRVLLTDIAGGDLLDKEIGSVDLPEANVAVLVGTALDPTRPRDYPSATVRTLWGELAYQIGQAEGYAMVEEADRAGVSPGSNTLSKLFDRFGPCLVIVDELVAYARNLVGVDRLPGGTFDSLMTFVQALTEAIRRSSDSMLLISIPESDIEVGGQAGKQALETLAHVVGRIESIWKPVSATESFEIVRRRLFAEQIDYAARDATVNAFADMYRNAAGEFPNGIAERDYIERLRACYPIHPELFDRLYQDWSTLERFQRTRGVLRLMAAVIHQLWTRGDAAPMIMPGTLPLDATPVRNELLRYLPETWSAVFDTDIDGPDSRPLAIDGAIPALGRYGAARRVGRAIFIGSAPSVAGSRVRGLEEIRIRLGCAQPGEPAAIFGDALRRMAGQLTYLYTDGSRYWYDTHPTVNKLARDRAQGYRPEEVDGEVVTRLRAAPRNRDFAAFHVAPAETGDVSDDDQVRVVVLAPDRVHKRAATPTLAQNTALAFLERRGNAQRLYKNMLIFIAPDEGDTEALRTAVRDFLAWRSIKDEEEQLNLDAQQRRQVQSSLRTADETVDLRLATAYSWLLVPTQPDPLGSIDLQAIRISGDANIYDRAARKLHNDGLLITDWSPDILRMELERFLWNDQRGWEVGLKQLWEYLAQYCYFPRLLNHQVLLAAVQAGVGRLDAPIAYATGKDPDGYHTGIVHGSINTVYFDDRSLLVHPDRVRRRPAPVAPQPLRGEEETGVPAGSTLPAGQVAGPGGRATPPPARGELLPPQAPKLVRYYGRAKIDPQRVARETAVIIEEVIQRLTSQVGAEVEVSLEIKATKRDGFDDQAVRTVSENSRTLRFETFDFEEE